MTHPQRDITNISQRKLALIIFLVVVFGLYLFGHSNTEARLVLANGLTTLSRSALDIGSVAALFVISSGIGRRALKQYDFGTVSLPEEVAIQSSIGIGIVAVTTATLGLIGFFNLALWGLLAGAAVYTARDIRGWFRDLRIVFTETQSQPSPWGAFISRVTGVLLLAALILALAPPYASDSLASHLVIPQTYIDAGRIVQNLDNHFFGFPQNMEMLYGLLMMLGTDRAPAVLHLVMGLLALMAVGGLMRRYASQKAAYTAILLLMSSYSLWRLFGWPYVDLALMTYSAVALIAITQWRASNYSWARWLGLAALACGFAAGVKYTAMPLLVAIYLFAAVRNTRHIVRNTLIFGGFGLLVFLPWFAKGIMLYENPVYPFIFEGINWDSVRTLNFSEGDQGIAVDNAFLSAQILLLPLAATTLGIDGETPYYFTTGPFLLMLPFLLLIGWQQMRDSAQKLARDLVPIALVMLAFWMGLAATTGVGVQTRLMLVSAPLAAILGGLAYHSIENWPRRPVNGVLVIQTVLIAGLLYSSFDYLHQFARSRALEYHAGVINDDLYITTNAGPLHPTMRFLDTLPPDSSVLFLWEGKTYYCPQDITCIPDVLFDNWARPQQQGTPPSDIIAQWRDRGIDYFVVHDDPLQPAGYSRWMLYHDFAESRNASFPQVFFDFVEPIYTAGAYTVYTWSD